MSNKYIFISLFFIAFVTQSCGVNKKKNTSSTTTAPATNTNTADMEPVVDNKWVELNQWIDPIYYTTMKYKANCSYSSNKINQDFTAKISVQKDEKIMISIIGLGIMEVARALVTPDSLFLINRINSTAYKKDYTYLAQLTGVDVDFQTFQSILTNELPQRLIAEIKKDDPIVELSYKPSPDLQAVVEINSQKREWEWMQLFFQQPQIDSVKLDLNDYQEFSGVPVSMKRKVSVNMPREYQELEMELDGVEINSDINFNFKIPSRFTIVD